MNERDLVTTADVEKATILQVRTWLDDHGVFETEEARALALARVMGVLTELFPSMEERDVIAEAIRSWQFGGRSPVIAYQADHILAGLKKSGYAIVPAVSIVNRIEQMARLRGQIESGFTDGAPESIDAELSWLQGLVHGRESPTA